MSNNEELKGYLVDILCVRGYPQDELVERARKHTKECALHPQCIESGYALISESGSLALLDSSATLRILDVVRNDKREQGIQVKVNRTAKENRMETASVEVV
jgi:hypothetical protein